MGRWTAEIMSDPLRDHKLHVELLEDGVYRARLVQDDDGALQLRIYGGKETVIPVDWLAGIVCRFQDDLAAIHGQSK
jgi:hypothetical protein